MAKKKEPEVIQAKSASYYPEEGGVLYFDGKMYHLVRIAYNPDTGGARVVGKELIGPEAHMGLYEIKKYYSHRIIK